MATGIPKKDKALSNGRVYLTYRGKATEEETPNTTVASFDKLHSDPSAKRLYFGDNLDVLRVLAVDYGVCGKIDLIYIDPPFATQSQFVSRKNLFTIFVSK